jgi:hypothetical protein
VSTSRTLRVVKIVEVLPPDEITIGYNGAPFAAGARGVSGDKVVFMSAEVYTFEED